MDVSGVCGTQERRDSNPRPRADRARGQDRQDKS